MSNYKTIEDMLNTFTKEEWARIIEEECEALGLELVTKEENRYICKNDNVKFSKWIPITEGLPNLNEHVWITFKEDEELFVGDYVLEDYHGNMVFFEPDEGRMSIPLSWVTAWMPYAMPKPYRGYDNE